MLPGHDFDAVDLERLAARRCAKWSRYGPDVIAAWVADMDFPVAEPVRTALHRAVDDSDLGYPGRADEGPLPGLFAARMAERHGWEVDPSLVTVISDVVQGIELAIGGLSDPGDGVVIQPPVYPPFFAAVEEMGRRLVENPLLPGPARPEVDLDGLRRAVERSEHRARILLLCNPHNPTGRVLGRDELAAVAGVALEHDLWIVSDEIHADLVFPGSTHVPTATLGPEVARRTVTLTSASKAFNVAGLRCAVAAFGSEEARRRFSWVPAHVRGGLGSLGLLATEAAWTEGQPWLDAALAYLDGNRRLLGRLVADRLPSVGHQSPEATYLAWLDCRQLDLPGGPYEFFLRHAGVGLSDGRDFGRPGLGHVRLNFATSRTLLTEVVDRMARAVAAR
jgi:cysteine-S-conjugate beta-lyase